LSSFPTYTSAPSFCAASLWRGQAIRSVLARYFPAITGRERLVKTRCRTELWTSSGRQHIQSKPKFQIYPKSRLRVPGGGDTLQAEYPRALRAPDGHPRRWSAEVTRTTLLRRRIPRASRWPIRGQAAFPRLHARNMTITTNTTDSRFPACTSAAQPKRHPAFPRQRSIGSSSRRLLSCMATTKLAVVRCSRGSCF
jgi:hypothetical protein